MPRYRVLEKSFVDNHIRDKDDIVSYAGKASSNLQLVDDDGNDVVAKKAAPAKAPAPADTGEDLA